MWPGPGEICAQNGGPGLGPRKRVEAVARWCGPPPATLAQLEACFSWEGAWSCVLADLGCHAEEVQRGVVEVWRVHLQRLARVHVLVVVVSVQVVVRAHDVRHVLQDPRTTRGTTGHVAADGERRGAGATDAGVEVTEARLALLHGRTVERRGLR